VAVPVVLDTNVVVKFFIEEPDDKEQIQALLKATLQEQARPVVPDFLFVEFANTLWLKLRSGDLTVPEAETALADLEAWSDEAAVIPFFEGMLPVVYAARRYDHAVYDMAFVVLAEKQKAPFITADRKLYLKIRGDYDKVFLLQSLSPERLQSEVLRGKPSVS
jgi:predicted nucleic acid-binding protein